LLLLQAYEQTSWLGSLGWSFGWAADSLIYSAGAVLNRRDETSHGQKQANQDYFCFPDSNLTPLF